MYPTLFTVGKFGIPTYTVLLDLGLILGLVLTYFEGKRQLGSAESALDLGLWTVIGGILGGRIGFVLVHLDIFSEDWGQVVQIWKGGLAFHGAFFGGLLVLLVFFLLQRRREHSFSFWRLADAVVPGLSLGLVFGWAACLMGGCAYGALGQGFGTMIAPDLYGIEAQRFATQIFGLIQSAILFILFWLLRSRWPFAGEAFCMYCLLYFGGQFFVEFTRGDEALYFGPFRLAQVLNLALALAAAAGLLVLWWKARSRERETLTEVEQADQGEMPEELEGEVEPIQETLESEGASEADRPEASAQVERLDQAETPPGA